MKKHVLALVLAALAGAAHAQATTSPDPGFPELADWQKRQMSFRALLPELSKGSAEARASFESRVRAFEQAPFSLTPPEAMDIIGTVFVPQAGPEKMLPLIAAHAALGLYDIYRFASPFGERLIIDSEGFLRRALSLGGADVTAKARAFMRDNPERTDELVREGLRLARQESLAQGYDMRWPIAVSDCPIPDPKICPPHTAPDAKIWSELWGKAVQRVLAYYRVEKN